jgi:hypothetical protein
MADQMPQMPMPPTAIAGLDALVAIEQVAMQIAHEVSVMGGGQYAFHPDELRTVLTQWQQLDDTVTNALHGLQSKAPNPTSLQPGDENASTTVANATHGTNQAYQTYLTSMQNYINGYVTKLQTVLDAYTGTESANSNLAVGHQRSLRA